MLNLYTISTKKETTEENFSNQEKFSVLYHDLFDYPLSFSDLIRWKTGKQSLISNFPPGHRPVRAGGQFSIVNKNGYWFIEGKDGITYKRVLRKRISTKKMEIAKRAAKVLSFIPWVKMVAVTGSLAMGNASEESDIDLMIVTQKGALWTTRLFAYSLIRLFGIETRSPKDMQQKDKLCLNMWLDENDLIWKKSDRNLYTAHEIAQIVPLVNKNKTYDFFLLKNKWILSFWPNSVKIRNSTAKLVTNIEIRNVSNFVLRASNLIAFKIQYAYMKNKISREIVTPTRALFHPQNWGKVVLGRLSS